MTGMELSDWNGNKVGVIVSFDHNETIPKLHFVMDDERLADMDAEGIFNLIKVGEANTNAIWQFDKKYDWDCIAYFDEDENVFIEKFACDDETDNPFVVELPKVQECVTFCRKCPLYNYNPRNECRFDELYPREK